jgi:hypothetical protein
MRVLLACERSQQVCNAMRQQGHEAYSCDILPTTGNNPDWHIQDDVLNHIDRDWELMIAFPPCTHLAVSGAKHFHKKQHLQREAIRFVKGLMNAPIPHIALENPVSVISTCIRKPDQIIQPWQFGHNAQKRTCLWLHDVPELKPTKIVGQGEFEITDSGNRIPKWYSNASKEKRMETFSGIAEAMATQWNEARLEQAIIPKLAI